MPGLGFTTTVAATSTDLPPGVRMDSASTAHVNEKPKLDPSDPRVRKLVYSMYRGMLTTYNGEANDIISKKDPAKVTQDSGVGPILESIVLRQRSLQGSGGDSSEPPPSSEGQPESESTASNDTETVAMPPPPPPPPMMPGSLPTVRLNSEIGPRDKGPPAALAGAMMKDKKPFTYTPGGIDLSEIRSPRMAKRIQMNARAEGVCNTPTPSSSNQERPPCHLPPAALAAMQPQMAIPVFPQGNITKPLNRSHRPSDYNGAPPPPPPMPAPVMAPPPVMPSPVVTAPPMITLPVAAPPSPQPVVIRPMTPVSPTSPKSPQTPPITKTPPPPPERASTPKSPVPPADSYLGNSRPSSQTSYLEELKSSMGRKSPNAESATGVGTGCIYIPPIQSPPPPPPPAPFAAPLSPYAPSSRPAGQTKAQAVSQNIGSIYIPPIGSMPNTMDAQPSVGGGNASNGSANISRIPQSAQATPLSASIPATPQLNKAPVPWMNSYNRMQNQTDSPPYVHPGYFMPPPWGPPPGARTIPIMMPRESDQTDAGSSDSRPSSAGSGGSTPTGSRTPSQAATHLGRVIPIQIEREDAMRQKGAKIIPIQIEGRPPRAQTPSTPATPMINPMRRVVGPPPYNSPMGMYSNQNVMDAYQRQASEAAAGVDRMQIRCESPRTDPAQSKSMRVIQQAAENELKRYEQEQQQHRLEMSEDDRCPMGLFKSQVDEGSFLHQTTEPRFLGSHIPSKAFRALQTALPATPGAQDQPPPSYPAAQPGQVHHIPIRQVSQSPTPQSLASEIQVNSQTNVPPSEQKVQEPKKYMGSNIPSRSFKILQAMTADDGQSETVSSEQNSADSYDDTISPCPSTENVPLSPCSSQSSYPIYLSYSSEDGGSSTFDPYNSSQNPWPDIMDQGWDPYSYMWYYWWYYSSCYWAGYDMTGYEYPPGWDPNYPYCPPELFGDYSTLSEYTSGGSSDQCNLGDTNDAPSEWSGTDLHKSLAGNGVESGYYEHDNDSGRMPSENNTLPRIVVEEGDMGRERKYCQDRENNVDSIKDNNNSNNNDGSTNKAPNPLTECNQKPGNPIPYKRNDCDSVGEKTFWKGEQENFAECKQLQNGNDNDEDEEGRGESEHEDSSSEDEFESCCEDEQKVIERETGPCNKLFVNQNQRPDHFSGTEQKSREREFEFHGNYNSELNANDDHHCRKDEKREGVGEEDDDEDEKTDPGADDDNDDDDDDYGGRVAIIEEPETPSSADDSDGAPLVNEHQRAGKSSAFYSNGGLSIEEYHSEESSDSAVFDYGLKKNRLSTIDEITESRASSSLFSRNLSAELDCCANTSNSPNENSGLQQIDAKGESEDSSESSEDELSSVSVIENKSDATRGTESKREDETTSSSEEDSSTDDDDADDDDDDAGAADTAVTVRLPLKLCFTKTKSYRDITTVMVGDSEIEKTGTQDITEDVRSRGENEELAQGNNVDEEDDNAPNVPDTTEDIEEDEPVVSFTLSLSRQTSRSDDESPKSETTKGCSENAKNNKEDEAADIDFWATIKSDESETTSSITVRFSPTAEVTTGGNPRANAEEESCRADVDFWGVIARDGSATNIHRIRKENVRGSNRCVSYHEPSSQDDQWDPYESIDYKWEQDFNFWEKSSRTIETRRFSSNFEITEDYESDSGLKPSSKRERVKKYTHHKRHSIPGPGWDRSSLPPRSAPAKQPTSLSKPPPNEQETRDGKGSSGNNESGSERASSSNGQTVDASQDDTDASSWWSYWDEVSKKNEGKSENNEERAYIRVEKAEPGVGTPTESRTEDIVESQREESSDISVEIKLSDAERNSTGESCTEDEYQSFAYLQTSRSEERGSGGFSSLERKDSEVKDRKSLNHSCQSDATTVTTDNDDYSSSPEIKSSPLFPTAANQEAEKLIQASSACISVSDENSDESSSRSSGTTIGRHDKSEIKKQPLSTPLVSPAPAADEKADSECLLKSSAESTLPVDTSIQIPVSIERTVEIHQELGERMKLNGKQQQQDELQHTACTGSINTSSSCTCLMGDRIARAENLLWRIERFLHESLSLGSEDDSGVMTDLSRQISDVDTDVDNDLNETEFLLTAAAAAKERRGMASKDSQHIESCNFAETISSTDTPSQQPSTSPLPTSAQVKKPRPKSDIILESSLTKLETETVEENNGVKMRSASERRALRYQRAKTHSRLFQLLQDECGGRDEEQDEFDYDSDVGTPTKGTILSPTHFATEGLINVESSTVQSIHVDTSSGTATHSHSSCNNGMDDHSHNGMSPRMNDAQARRSRLLPLPIKNLLASSLSLDSNSSPSGSSGVLSPTSPVNRDQLLADIINEFHVRNQVSTLRAQSQRRISSSFPSKIFKLLQHEFGEEFYQTFDCCGGGGGGGEDSLISPCMSTNLCVNDSTSLACISQAAAGAAVVHECTIHKSESMKEFEEATNRILTNIMLRNKQKASACQPNSESPSSTATMSSQLLQDDSKKTSADFLEVPMRKKKANLSRDPRSPKSTKKS